MSRVLETIFADEGIFQVTVMWGLGASWALVGILRPPVGTCVTLSIALYYSELWLPHREMGLIPMALIWGRFCPLGAMWQYLQILLIVTVEECYWHLERPGMLLNILQCTGQLPQPRIIWLQMSIVRRWRNPAHHMGLIIIFENKAGKVPSTCLALCQSNKW